MIAERREDVPVVPREALAERGGRKVVFVLNGSGSPARRRGWVWVTTTSSRSARDSRPESESSCAGWRR